MKTLGPAASRGAAGLGETRGVVCAALQREAREPREQQELGSGLPRRSGLPVMGSVSLLSAAVDP